MTSEDYALNELTPDSLRCGAGPYQRIYEFTPADLQCAGIGCPGIYEQNKENYFIIGTRIDPKQFGLEKKVSKGESLISVPKALIEDLKKSGDRSHLGKQKTN